jgi:transposase
MLQFTPQHRLLLATTPVDFRKGIDGLAALCRKVLTQDPFSGTFFIFTNKRKTAVKILIYDGQGFWLCLKRFSRGRLAWWPTQSTLSALTAQQLTVLLYQGHPLDLKLPADFRPLMSFDNSTVGSSPGPAPPRSGAVAAPLSNPPD